MVFDACYLIVGMIPILSQELYKQARSLNRVALCQTKRLFKCHKRMVGTHARASSQHHQGMCNKCLLAERWELHRITSKSGWPAVNGSLHVHFYKVQFHKVSTSIASFWSSSSLGSVTVTCLKTEQCEDKLCCLPKYGINYSTLRSEKTMIMDGFSEMFEGTNLFFPLDLGTRRCGLWMSGKDTVPVSILWRVTERLAKPNMLRDPIYFIGQKVKQLRFWSIHVPDQKKKSISTGQVPSHVFWKACATPLLFVFTILLPQHDQGNMVVKCLMAIVDSIGRWGGHPTWILLVCDSTYFLRGLSSSSKNTCVNSECCHIPATVPQLSSFP